MDIKSDKLKRKDDLQKDWEKKMPCIKCDVAKICKYFGTFSRPDYNPDIFIIDITCKLKREYNMEEQL